MSDIGYTRKLGDGFVARPQAAAAATAATAATATVANLPATLANITTGALLKALVTAQTTRGVTTLKTDNGTLSIQTQLPLKPGNELVLQVQSTGTQTRMVILSIDNRPVSATRSGPLNAPSPSTPAPNATAPTPGPVTNATANGVPPHGPTGTGEAAAGRASTSGTPSPHAAARHDTIASVRSPPASGLVLPGRVSAEGLPAVDLTGNNTPRTLATGDTVTVRILQIGPAGQQIPPAPAGSQPLRATVVADPPATGGKGPAPATTLAIGAGRLTLPAPPPGPPGTAVTLQILDARRPAPPQKMSGVEQHRDFLRLGTDWRTLKEAMTILSGAPTPVNGAEQTPVPRPGPQMASSMLFFMAALKGGDLGTWLGDHGMEQLGRATGGQLLAQLMNDFTAMARHAGDGQPSGWQALAVPVATEQGIEQFRLYYRRQGQRGGEDGKDATHFVVEADLSRIGLLQLEGLVRPRRFDLTIHATQMLGELMQTDIRRIFHDALSVGGLAGTLRFDVGEPVPFSPPGTSPSANRTGTAVVV